MRIHFTLPYFSATKLVRWECHVDDPTKGRYYMILGRDLLTALGLNLRISEQIIEAGDDP